MNGAKVFPNTMALERESADGDASSSEAQVDMEPPVSQLNMSSENEPQITVTADDDESLSTVLSEQSLSDDEASVGSDSSCIRQLEIELKKRDKILKKLVKGIDPVYAQAMRANEETARKQKILRAKQKQRQRSASKTTRPLAPSSTSTTADQEMDGSDETIGYLERIRLALACDLHNTLQGASHMILYCLAHGCCFQITEVCFVALTKSFKNQDVVAIVTILSSILLLRITGGMWSYLEYNSYNRVKFDMHNRLRLGKTDAYVALWFRHHPKIQNFLNLVAFYVSFESVSYLHERCMEIVHRNLLVFIDSFRLLKQRLLSGDTCAVDGVCDLEEEALVNERNYTLYYVASAVIAIVLLQMLGHPFLRR